MIEAIDINKRFGGVVALSDANLTVKTGEVRALVGGNGSGKSTLSKILAGSYKPDKGQIFVNGELVKINSPKDAANLGIFLTYQELSLFSNLTVAENLLISNLPNKAGVLTDQKDLKAKAKSVLDLLNVGHYRDKLVSEVPINDKYMVELAKAIIQKPKFLLIDEVASAFRREQVQLITDVIQQLCQNGTGVLYVTHRLHEVYAICESVTIMRSGKTILTTSLNEITPEEIINYLSPENDIGETKKVSPSTVSIKHKADFNDDIADDILLQVDKAVIPGYDTSISIRLKRGEIVGIAGLKGQGQSRLLRMIFGEIPADNVMINIKGQDIHVSAPSIAIENSVGFLSGDRQKEGVFPIRSVKENVEAIPEKFYRDLSETDRLSTSDVIKRLNVVLANLNQPIRLLSGGNQQKVIIGRWMTLRPDILLCDDPTKGVDYPARLEVHKIFKDMAQQNTGIIFSSSDDSELINVADRILVIYNGAIVKELTGEEMTEENIIAASIPME